MKNAEMIGNANGGKYNGQRMDLRPYAELVVHMSNKCAGWFRCFHSVSCTNHE